MSPSAGSSHPMDLTPEALRGLRRALLDHYDRVARPLPWRRETDPYRILVSEVMLQQTRVETVLPYYRRWLERFPNVASLAAAREDEVLKLWEGLGYYRRARNLHAAAVVVREELGGRVPTTFEALRSLPGVGEYTAGAVASIGFGARVPAVDGNVRRVVARLFDEEAPTVARVKDVAAAMVDPERPGDWNQALMELGATVCTPRAPVCGGCPISTWCRAREAGTQAQRPGAKPKPKVRVETFVTAVVVDPAHRVLVERRPTQGLLGGLWSFPDAPLAEEGDLVDAARDRALETGASLDRHGPAELLPVVPHKFSHIHATYRPVLFRGTGVATEQLRWIALDGDEGLALPVAQQKIARAAADILTADSGAGPTE